MENNEYLTSLQLKINNDIEIIKKSYNIDKEKFCNLESNFVKISKFMKQNEKEYDLVTAVCIIILIIVIMQLLIECFNKYKNILGI
jgi:hypothetical protein